MHQTSSLIPHPSSLLDYVPQCAPGARASARARVVWGALVAGAFVFVGLIFCAPLAQAQGHATLARALYHAFGAVCHQLPARSYYLTGQPLAVCARCAGVYSGFALGVLAYPLARSLRRTDVPARGWLLLAALPTCVDFALGVTGVWANTHTSRALTGALLGAAAAAYVVPGLIDFSGLVRRRRARAPRAHAPSYSNSEAIAE